MVPLNASGSRALFLVFACANMPQTSLQQNALKPRVVRCAMAKASLFACVLAHIMITSDNRSSRNTRANRRIPPNTHQTPIFKSISLEIETAARFRAAEKASATLRAYNSGFRIFTAWCQDRALVPMPAVPEVLAAYLAYEVGQNRRPSTLSRRLAAYNMRIDRLAMNRQRPRNVSGRRCAAYGEHWDQPGIAPFHRQPAWQGLWRGLRRIVWWSPGPGHSAAGICRCLPPV